jgi:hypothetical protein
VRYAGPKRGVVVASPPEAPSMRRASATAVSCAAIWTTVWTTVWTAFSILACAPVGSEAWCEKMKNKPKGDWTANEAGDYALHCVLR